MWRTEGSLQPAWTFGVLGNVPHGCLQSVSFRATCVLIERPPVATQIIAITLKLHTLAGKLQVGPIRLQQCFEMIHSWKRGGVERNSYMFCFVFFDRVYLKEAKDTLLERL